MLPAPRLSLKARSRSKQVEIGLTEHFAQLVFKAFGFIFFFGHCYSFFEQEPQTLIDMEGRRLSIC